MKKTKTRRKPNTPRWPKGVPAPKDGREFDALSDEDKEKIWQYYDREIPLSESRPLTAAEWAKEKRAKKMGRPKIGQGAKVVAVTLERGLLDRVDAYAKKHEMKRAELITRGLRLAMGEIVAS